MDSLESQSSAFNLGKKAGGVVNSSTRMRKGADEMKSYHETCQKCNMKVSSKAMFCSHCGYVQIKNDLIHESSTSIYDPGDRSVRPWREKSKVAKNSWKSRIKNVEVGKREPWRPTMRQARVNKRIVLGVPSLLQRGSKDKEPVELTAHEKRKRYDDERKIEVRYKGRIWRRAGENAKRKNALKQVPSMWTLESQSSESSSFIREVPDEEVFPLAVFEVNWMSISSSEERQNALMTIHISLYQHVKEDIDLETNKVQRWLRVGYLLDSDSSPEADTLNDEADALSPGGTLKILEFLPNEVAKCMGVKESEWVDLDYIDLKNSYMVDHLQHSLIHIARRVVSRVRNDSMLFDQNSTIQFVDSTGAEVFNHGHEDDEEDMEEEGASVFSGSYSKSVMSIRKLISKEDESYVSKEVESGSEYIRRHLNDEEGQGQSDAQIKTEDDVVEESSSDFIRRHLAESTLDDENKAVEENSTDFIRRHLSEAGLDSDLQHEEKETVALMATVQHDDKALYEEYKAKCEEERDLNEEVELDDLTLVNTVAQISSPIPLGDFYLNKHVNTKVWMSVEWNRTDGVGKTKAPKPAKLRRAESLKSMYSVNSSVSFQQSGTTYDTITGDMFPNAACGSGVLLSEDVSHDTAPGSLNSVEFLAKVPCVESITLKLFPMYYDEMAIQPKIINFSTWSLTMLLDIYSVRTQMMASNDVHVFHSDKRLSSDDVSAYVLFCLSKGPLGAHKLCRTLIKCMRYEHTTEGVRVFVNGAENNFSKGVSPEETKLKLLEDANASLLIQCLCRGAIARRKFRNLVIKDRKKRHESMNKAAIEIQRIARGYIERAMVKALLCQIKENEEKARLLAEAEARDKILFCTMNGTDVEIIADSGDSEVESDDVKTLTHMNVTVTDAESRMHCSLRVEKINIDRIWALYMSSFKIAPSFKSVAQVFNNLRARKKLLMFMANKCMDLFFSRQSGFMKLTLKELIKFIDEISIRIVSASDLINSDAMFGGRIGGKSDPYVVVHLGQEKFQTKVIKNNLNPEWGEEFTFKKWNHEDNLVCEVFDKDLLSKDDLLGKCDIQLTDVAVPSKDAISMDSSLTECDHGSLQIEIRCTWEDMS